MVFSEPCTQNTKKKHLCESLSLALCALKTDSEKKLTVLHFTDTSPMGLSVTVTISPTYIHTIITELPIIVKPKTPSRFNQLIQT